MGYSNDEEPYFYFLVVFWGQVHRDYFEQYCLASLMAPGNIPALSNKKRSRFLICTTPEDRQELQKSLLFISLQEHIEIEWLEMPMPKADENKMNVMSRGHKRLTMRAFEDQVYVVNVNPDTIFSDGTLIELERHARDGRRLVFYCAVRFELEGVTQELTEKGFLETGRPLALPARQGVDIALRNRHPELQACNFDSAAYWDYPVSTFLEVPNQHGIALHCFSWAGVLIDYRHIVEHNVATFENWTLDGDYIHNNFLDLDIEKDIYVVRDSDEFFLLSITSRDEALMPDMTSRLKSFPFIGEWYRAFLLNCVFVDSRIDPMKKIIFTEPVRLHANDLNEAWKPVEKRLIKLLAINLDPVDEFWAGVSVADTVKQLKNHPILNFQLDGAKKHSIFFNFIKEMLIGSTWNFLVGFRKYVIKPVFQQYREVIRIIILVFAYSRVTVLAILGNKTEQERIAKRIKLLRGMSSDR